jgi:hypothetical protein
VHIHSCVHIRFKVYKLECISLTRFSPVESAGAKVSQSGDQSVAPSDCTCDVAQWTQAISTDAKKGSCMSTRLPVAALCSRLKKKGFRYGLVHPTQSCACSAPREGSSVACVSVQDTQEHTLIVSPRRRSEPLARAGSFGHGAELHSASLMHACGAQCGGVERPRTIRMQLALLLVAQAMR